LSAGVMLTTCRGIDVESAPADGRGRERKDPRQKNEPQEPRCHPMLPSSRRKNSHAASIHQRET